MKFFLYFLPAALATLVGCQSKNADPLPSAEGNKFKLTVNVEEAAPQPSTSVRAGRSGQTAQVRPSSKKTSAAAAVSAPIASQGNLDTTAAHKTLAPNPVAESRVLVPDPSGVIDSDLNSVEQNYINQVRQRNRQKAKANEDKIFGSFSPQALFGPGKQKK